MAHSALGDGLGSGGHLGSQRLLRLLELVEVVLEGLVFILEFLVLALEVRQSGEDLVEFLHLLQNPLATSFLSVHPISDRHDRCLDSLIADNPASPISDRNLDSAVDPATCPARVVGGRALLTTGSDLDLVCPGSVLDKKIAHRLGSSAPQIHVVAGRTDAVGVTLQFDAEVRVLLQQFRQAQQTGETVGEYRPVGREVDLFPVTVFLLELLADQGRC